MTRIEYFFPQSIYVTENVCTDILPELEDACKKVQIEYGTNRNGCLYVDSCHITASTILKHQYPFTIVAENIKIHVANYAKSLGYAITADDIHIDNMWFNVSNQGDFNFPHAHGDCHFSGAFYIKTTEENEIVFVHPNYHNGQIPNPDNSNESSHETMAFKCEVGNMMVWRNYLIHYTHRQRYDGEKIVISFNTRIKRPYD